MRNTCSFPAYLHKILAFLSQSAFARQNVPAQNEISLESNLLII